MKLQGFSVFDDKAGAYVQPFFVPNVNIAIRSFGDAVANPETGISKHASDYHLYRLGDFDDNSGEFTQVQPEFIANAVDFMPIAKGVKNEENIK